MVLSWYDVILVTLRHYEIRCKQIIVKMIHFEQVQST